MDDAENQPASGGGMNTGQGQPMPPVEPAATNQGMPSEPEQPAMQQQETPSTGQQAPGPQPEPQPQQPEQPHAPERTKVSSPYAAKPPAARGGISPHTIINAIIIIVVIGAAILIFHPKGTVTSTSTSTTLASTTTVSRANYSNINNCTVISKPGTYFLTGQINTNIQSGACINVESSNVKLLGNEHSIIGAGPYTGVPPFSYGIEVTNVTNVTISGFNISTFSYDIFLSGVHNSNLANNNLSAATLSVIYVSKSTNDTIQNNYVSDSQSDQGGIDLNSGNNKLFNNTIANNLYFGLLVNSSNNNMSRNIFTSNPVDLFCNTSDAFRYSNKFSDSMCSVNDYCEFATCKTNAPLDLSSLQLSPGTITSCGAITASGNYSLSSGLSTSLYINTSNPANQKVACITVSAPFVNFDCRNNAINNSAYGISISGAYQANVSDCSFSNDTYGIYANNVFDPGITNVTASKSYYGIYLNNATTGKIVNAKLVNNTYGLYLNASTSVLIDQLSAHENYFGVYTNSGNSNVFTGGSSINNTKTDMFCTPLSYNASTNLMQNFQCGVTSCQWAYPTCPQYVAPRLSYFPVAGCQTITHGGNYTVKQTIIAPATCFNVESDNVTFNCNGLNVTGPGSGSAFALNHVSNFTLSNCHISQFSTAVNASNSKLLDVSNLIVDTTAQGVYFSNVSRSAVSGVRITGATTSGFYFQNINDSVIQSNLATAGGANPSLPPSGFIFQNVTNSKIEFNNATFNPGYGYELVNTKGDSIANNSANSNMDLDYYCSPSISGLYANPMAVDYGLTKNTCSWLVELSPIVQSQPCEAISSQSTINLQRDMLYTSGTTCFSVYVTPAEYSANGVVVRQTQSGNYSVINCNGHTIYSTSKGTFVNVVNASNVEIENCILRGFGTGVSSSGLDTTVLNNTITYTGTAVTLPMSRSATVTQNLIENDTNGIVANNASYANIENNMLFNVSNAMIADNSLHLNIQDNNALGGSIGLSMYDTTLGTMSDTVFSAMNKAGAICNGTSQSPDANIDDGGNSCTSNVNCAWISASQGCRPSS